MSATLSELYNQVETTGAAAAAEGAGDEQGEAHLDAWKRYLKAKPETLQEASDKLRRVFDYPGFMHTKQAQVVARLCDEFWPFFDDAVAQRHN